MELNQAVLQLDAAAEPSRLRLLVALLGGETSVGDLVTVLEQSQPRVSRHLRLLAEAGLVESFREGRSIFYRWSAEGLDAGVASSVAAVAASDDPTIARDRERLQKLSRQRERDALRRALRAGRGRGLHVADGDTALADSWLPRSPTARRHAGSPRATAARCDPQRRLRLGRGAPAAAAGGAAGHRHRAVGAPPPAGPGASAPGAACRAGPSGTRSPRRLPFEAGAFDLVILQDVLAPARSDELQAILAEAARVLRPAGRLLILDRILPTDSELVGAPRGARLRRHPPAMAAGEGARPGAVPGQSPGCDHRKDRYP